MASDITIRTTGIRETQRALYAYSQQLGDKIVLRALREGAKVMQKQARKLAPRKTGKLRRNITVKNSKIYSKRRSRNKLGVFITINQKGKADNPRNAFYGRFIEDGFKPRGNSRRVSGVRFTGRAFAQKRQQAVDTTIRATEIAADLLAKRRGL